MMFLHQEVQNLMNFILNILKLLFTSYFIDQIWEHRACTRSLLPHRARLIELISTI